MKDRKRYNNSFEDKRILLIYIIIIIAILTGVTYALESVGIAFNLETGIVAVDEAAYGSTSFDSSNVNLVPILDSQVETRLENVIKIDFTVGGASTNTVDTIIYDIALVDLMLDCNLLSEYFKWKLVKDGSEVATGSFSYQFDTIVDGRLVLTNPQFDLPDYSANKTGYHNFSFYIWLSDSCQDDLETCKANNNIVDQTYLTGRYFSGKVEVELYTESKKNLVRKPATSIPGGSCIVDYKPMDETAASYIINKYNDGSAITTVNIGGSTSNPQIHLNANQGIMLDNNGIYRYYGADPDNYVLYNDELWRIISVGNVKSSATDTVGETRVKIVKADILKDDNNLSAYSYDSSASTVNSGYGVNDWSKADLMTELNLLYLNSTSGTCYTGQRNASTACNFTNTGLSAEARSLTADALYYLGGSSTYSGLYADDYYTFERGTTVYGCSTDDGACPRATTWSGRVGIIYPSDYVYATDLSVCTKNAFDYDTDTNCKSKDWLLYSSNYQWTISPYSSSAYGAFAVYSVGYVIGNLDVYGARAVRPVQYLRSEVTIVEGEGTTEKPYILGT